VCAELAVFEETLAAQRSAREGALGEQREKAAMLQRTNEALLARQYPQGGGGEAGGAEEDVSSAADAVRALCGSAGCASVKELLAKVLPQQASADNLRGLRTAARLQRIEVEAELSLARTHLEELRGGRGLTTQSQLDSAQVRGHGLMAAARAATHAPLSPGLLTCAVRVLY
jgi:hypothetical protein